MLFLIPITKSSMKRWIDDIGVHLPTPEETLRHLLALTPATECHIDEESRYFYTIPGRGIAALIQGLTRILTSKPACEAWSKGLSGAPSLSLALPYSCWYALAPPTVPRPLV